MIRNVRFVEPARGHIDTSFSNSADKQLSELHTDIAVTFCLICDRLLS